LLNHGVSRTVILVNTRSSLLAALLLAAAFATAKAHAQFDIEESHTTASLRGIHNVGAGVAWASGTNGTVLRTEDAGYLWQNCTIPPGAEKLDFRGIQGFDANTAIVMSSGPGDQSRLYKTTDGCQTWKLLFTNPDPDGFWDCVWLHPTGFGVLLGDPVKDRFALFETSDGGKSWRRDQRSGLVIQGKSIAAFAASNSLFTQTRSGYMLGFATGGQGGAFLFEAFSSRDWSRVPIPVASGTESSGVFSLGMRFSIPRCTDCEHPSDYFFVAVGGDYKKPNQNAGTGAWSADLGKTWTASAAPPHGYRSSVAYDPDQKLWITVGPNGTDISADDGKNWTPLKPSGYDSPDADKNWNALSLPFVVGPHGRIGRLRPITQK
jgi:photosystem II stability/assembly factor-like uncharacterized protein